LERIIDAGEGGLSQGMVKLQVVARQNAILVVTRKPQLLRTVATWIARLDNPNNVTGVKVYRVRYGDARQLAALLNEVFVGRSSTSLTSSASQIAPGAGISTSTSGRASPSTVIVTSPRQQSAATAAGFDARYPDAASMQGSSGAPADNNPADSS